MGRFDALTQLEESKPTIPPLPVDHSPIPKLQQPDKSPTEAQKKPASPLTRKTANPSPALNEAEKPEKYTTRLTPSLVKKIRLDAINTDMKDYEVVTTALNLYFEKKK